MTSASRSGEQVDQQRGDPGALGLQLTIGDAHRTPADADEPLVAAAVVLERPAGLVKARPPSDGRGRRRAWRERCAVWAAKRDEVALYVWRIGNMPRDRDPTPVGSPMC
jgi:hypothetical protein